VAAPSVPHKRGRSQGSRNKKTLAALAATAAATSSENAVAAVGGPSGVATGAACLPHRPSTSQPSAYTLANRFVTFLVPVLAGSEECLPLPFKFVDAMEG
jgi:hypothetical protein